MRILQLHTAYRQGGGEDVVVEAEASLLREAGHDVHQLIAHNPDRALLAAVNLTFAPWNPRMVRRVRNVVEEFRPRPTAREAAKMWSSKPKPACSGRPGTTSTN